MEKWLCCLFPLPVLMTLAFVKELMLPKIFAQKIRSDCISFVAHEGPVHGALCLSITILDIRLGSACQPVTGSQVVLTSFSAVLNHVSEGLNGLKVKLNNKVLQCFSLVSICGSLGLSIMLRSCWSWIIWDVCVLDRLEYEWSIIVPFLPHTSHACPLDRT